MSRETCRTFSESERQQSTGTMLACPSSSSLVPQVFATVSSPSMAASAFSRPQPSIEGFYEQLTLDSLPLYKEVTMLAPSTLRGNSSAQSCGRPLTGAPGRLTQPQRARNESRMPGMGLELLEKARWSRRVRVFRSFLHANLFSRFFFGGI